jgi:hypothetical protein
MNFLDALIMNLRFGFSEQRKDPGRSILNAASQTRVMDYLENVAEVPVSVLGLGLHPSMCGADSRTIYFFEIDSPTREPEQFQLRSQSERLNACGDQGTQNHVATGAGKTIEIQSFHLRIFSRKEAQKAQTKAGYCPKIGFVLSFPE